MRAKAVFVCVKILYHGCFITLVLKLSYKFKEKIEVNQLIFTKEQLCLTDY